MGASGGLQARVERRSEVVVVDGLDDLDALDDLEAGANERGGDADHRGGHGQTTLRLRQRRHIGQHLAEQRQQPAHGDEDSLAVVEHPGHPGDGTNAMTTAMIAAMSVSDLGQLLTNAGGASVLVFVVMALIRGWLVPGHVHDDVRQDRDDWKEIALASVNGAEKAITLAERRRADGVRQQRGRP